MSVSSEKLKILREKLLDPGCRGGALLVVYPPEEELNFRSKYKELIQELKAHGVAVQVLDFRTLVFDVLEKKKLLEKAFKLDAANSRDAWQNLARMVQRETARRVHEAAEQAPDAILCCAYTASLHPWISFSALLEEIEGTVSNTLVIPFPGTENGPALHFLGVRDGYNYRAARI